MLKSNFNRFLLKNCFLLSTVCAGLIFSGEARAELGVNDSSGTLRSDLGSITHYLAETRAKNTFTERQKFSELTFSTEGSAVANTIANSISSSSTDSELVTAKAVYDFLNESSGDSVVFAVTPTREAMKAWQEQSDHGKYELSTTATGVTNEKSIKIGSTTYYFIANEANDDMNQTLNQLLANETTVTTTGASASDYVFSLTNGEDTAYYKFDTGDISASNISISEGTASDHTYSSKLEDGSVKYYKVIGNKTSDATSTVTPSSNANIIGGYYEGITGSIGGALKIQSTRNINRIEADFSNNTSDNYGGAMIIAGNVKNLVGDFNNNTASSSKGGAIFHQNNTITNLSGNFNGNNATDSGGAIYVNGGFSAKIKNLIGNFNNNTSSSGYGGALAVGRQNAISGTVENIASNFSNNHADLDGGAIYNSGNINKIEGDFYGNSTNRNGGAIYHSNISTIDSVSGNFYENSAKKDGGAIYAYGHISLIDGNFDGNKAATYGGAIATGYDGKITTLKGNFTNNTAKYGGAIANAYNTDSERIVSLTGNFYGNKAQYYGGAIYLNSNVSTVNDAIVGILADGQDVIFYDNTDYYGYNDLYGGRYNLNAQSGYEINFGGTIKSGSNSRSGAVLNINNDADATNRGGNYVFNNTVDAGVNLYNGANVKLASIQQTDGTTSYGVINTTKTMTVDDVEGSNIDMINDHIDTNTVGGLNLGSNLGLGIDTSLRRHSASTSDKLVSTTAATGEGKMVINSINLTNSAYGEGASMSINIADDNTKGNIAIADDILDHITGATNYYTKIEYDEDTGNLIFTDKLINQSSLSQALEDAGIGDMSIYATAADLEALQTTVAGKADSATVTALVTTVAGKADASDLTTLQGTVTDLSTTVAGKADSSTVTALQTAVASKADQADLETLQGTVTDLSTTVAGKADQADLEALQTTVAGKADSSTVTALQTAVAGKADASDLTTLQGTVSDLSTTVAGKADSATVTALQTAVASKADQADLEALQGTVTDLSTTVAGKADSATVTALQTTVASKADQADLEALQTTVAGKADSATVTALQTAVAGKADQADLTALQGTVTDLSTTVAGKADSATVTALQTTVASKADQADLEALQTTVAGKADSATVTALQTAVAGKADQADLEALQTTVAGKANQADLEALQTTVAGKANQSDLETLQTTVAGKANQSDLETLQGTVTTLGSTVTDLSTTVAGKADQADLTALQTTVAGKADQADLEALQTTVANKASQADLETLQGTVTTLGTTVTDLGSTVTDLSTTVSGKANQSDLEALQTTVAGKADSATVTALQGTVSDLSTTIAGKADTATVTALATTVASKANQSDLETLQTTVAGKANAADVYSKDEADGKYATQTAISDMLTKTEAGNTYATQSAFDTYKTSNDNAVSALTSKMTQAETAIDTINNSAVMNSGITAEKVATYEGYAAQIDAKQDVLTTEQMAILNSGITAADIATVQTAGTRLDAMEGTVTDLSADFGDVTDFTGSTTGNLKNDVPSSATANASTVTRAIANMDVTIGQVHGLAAKVSTANGGGNLGQNTADTTVENHLTALAGAIGDRSNYSEQNYISNNQSVAKSLDNLDVAIGGIRNDFTSAQVANEARFNNVEHKINKLEDKMGKGLAANNALAGLVPLNDRYKTQVSMALGGYESNQAFAFGAFHYVTEKVLLNTGVAYGGNDSMSYNVGVTFGF